MISIKAKTNISTILIVGFCLPAYYKTKLILEGVISWSQVFDVLGLLEMIYALMLASLLVGFHRLVQQTGFKNNFKYLSLTFVSWIFGVLIAFIFTKFYFSVMLNISIQPSFEFDIAVLSLCLPLVLSGVGDRIFLEYQSQALALEAEKEKKQAIVARFEVLKMRLSPHFLFNSLNTLVDIIEQEPKLALSFVEHMATTYRYILDHKDKPMVLLSEELESIEALLFILKVRHNKTLNIDFQISSIFTPSNQQEMIAPLSLQELVENAIKHNKYSVDRPLCIKIYRSESNIVVENTINKRVNSDSHQSGLENLKWRIDHTFSQTMTVEEIDNSFRVSIPVQIVVAN